MPPTLDPRVDAYLEKVPDFARPMLELREILTGAAGVDGIQIDNEHVVFEYSSDRNEAAALLADLIRRGVPVASFSANVPGLEEAYMRTGIRQVD